MLAFILRRLAQALAVMLTVAFIAFMLFQYVGDPVTNLLGQDATACRDLTNWVDGLSEPRAREGLEDAERRLQPPVTIDDLWEIAVCLLALGGSEQAVTLLTPHAQAAASPEDWILAAVVARVDSADRCRAVLQAARERWSDDPRIASAEQQLLGL